MGLDFAEVRGMAMACPEAVEQDHHGFPSYRVGGKIFASLRPGATRMMVKLDPEDQRNFCEAHPETVAPVPGYWGRKGATFVDYVDLEAALVKTLIDLAWRRVAPKRLATGRPRS